MDEQKSFYQKQIPILPLLYFSILTQGLSGSFLLLFIKIKDCTIYMVLGKLIGPWKVALPGRLPLTLTLTQTLNLTQGGICQGAILEANLECNPRYLRQGLTLESHSWVSPQGPTLEFLPRVLSQGPITVLHFRVLPQGPT